MIAQRSVKVLRVSIPVAILSAVGMFATARMVLMDGKAFLITMASVLVFVVSAFVSLYYLGPDPNQRDPDK